MARRRASDLLLLQPAAAGGTNYTRTLSASISANDDPLRYVKNYRLIVDAGAVNDAIIRSIAMRRVIADPISSDDQVSRFAKIYRLAVDSVSTNDLLISSITVGGVTIISRVIAESLSINDLVSRGVRAHRLIAESTGTADSLARYVKAYRLAADILATAETAARALIANRVIADDAQVIDAVLRYTLIYRLMSEPLESTDSLVRSIVYLDEIIGFIALQLTQEPIIIDLSTAITTLPVAATHLTSGIAGGAITSVSTPSITPSANKLILLAFSCRLGTPTILPSPPTLAVTGNGLTWELVATTSFIQSGANYKSFSHLYRAVGAAPTTGAVTVDWSATTITNMNRLSYAVSEYDNLDISGNNGENAIVNVTTAFIDGGASTLTATLPAFEDIGNATFGFFVAGGEGTAPDLIPGAGFTAVSETNTAYSELLTQFNPGNSTSVYASAAASVYALSMIGVELRVANRGANGAALLNIGVDQGQIDMGLG